jgi:hypothetical protein
MRKFIYVVGLVVLAWIGWNWQLASRGYCFEEARFLSDKDFLSAALSHSSEIELNQYTEEFLKNHPECCTLSRVSHWLPFRGEAGFGFYDVFVHQIGPRRKSSYQNEKFTYFEEEIGMSACGKYSNRYYNEGIPAPTTAPSAK